MYAESEDGRIPLHKQVNVSTSALSEVKDAIYCVLELSAATLRTLARACLRMQWYSAVH